MNLDKDVIVVLEPESHQGNLAILHPHRVSLQILLHILKNSMSTLYQLNVIANIISYTSAYFTEVVLSVYSR
jgi:hypothetical protein